MKSFGSSSYAGSANGDGKIAAKQAIVNGVRVAFKHYRQTRNLTFPKLELARLKELKLMEHENLNKFYGISFNQQNELMVLWVLCPRGSLEVNSKNLFMHIHRTFCSTGTLQSTGTFRSHLQRISSK